MNCAIITAAGKGARMNAGVNKLLLELLGKPIIGHTIEAFEQAKCVDIVVLTAGDNEEVDTYWDIVNKYKYSKVKSIVLGGKERQDSVFNGIRAAGELGISTSDLLLIHNGANPLINGEDIKKGISAASECGAAVLGWRCKDTIKVVDDEDNILRTLDRKTLRAMQTPQIIRYDVALEAFTKAIDGGFIGTDDVQLVERIGHRVKFVECSYENIKITTPEDIILAEKILQNRVSAL